MLVDLHLHTKYSDGELWPQDLMGFARKYGLKVISITDHDSLSGIEEAVKVEKENGITVIPGLELTTMFEGQEIHMLGYGINYKSKSLKKELIGLRYARYVRIKRMLSKLREQGINIHDRDIFVNKDINDSHSEIVISYGRPHIARVLHEKGYVKNFSEAFEKYIGNNSSSYVPKSEYSTLKAIKLLKGAGGITVIAHPEYKIKEEHFNVFIENGLDGIEVYCPSHDEMQIYHYEIMVKNHGLIATAGSDMHSSKGYENKMKYLTRNKSSLSILKARFPEIFKFA